MRTSICKYEIGDIRLDIRQFISDKLTIQGIALTYNVCKMLDRFWYSISMHRRIINVQCAVDMQHGINSLYVHSDVIECWTVGDSSVPLLRVISTKGEYEEIQYVSYLYVHYIPLQRQCLIR